jgi:hypothetical protein
VIKMPTPSSFLDLLKREKSNEEPDEIHLDLSAFYKDGNKIEDLIEYLKRNQQIQSVLLGGFEQLSEPDTLKLARVIGCNEIPIKNLKVSRISDQIGTRNLADGLLTNTSIKNLNLEINSPISLPNTEYLFESTKHIDNIHLSCFECKTKSDYKKLAKILADTPSITSLDVFCDDPDFRLLFNGLKENKHLKYFGLHSWTVEKRDAIALVDALKINPNLKNCTFCLSYASPDAMAILHKFNSDYPDRSITFVEKHPEIFSRKTRALHFMGLEEAQWLKHVNCYVLDEDEQKIYYIFSDDQVKEGAVDTQTVDMIKAWKKSEQDKTVQLDHEKLEQLTLAQLKCSDWPEFEKKMQTAANEPIEIKPIPDELPIKFHWAGATQKVEKLSITAEEKICDTLEKVKEGETALIKDVCLSINNVIIDPQSQWGRYRDILTTEPPPEVQIYSSSSDHWSQLIMHDDDGNPIKRSASEIKAAFLGDLSKAVVHFDLLAVLKVYEELKNPEHIINKQRYKAWDNFRLTLFNSTVKKDEWRTATFQKAIKLLKNHVIKLEKNPLTRSTILDEANAKTYQELVHFQRSNLFQTDKTATANDNAIRYKRL